MEKKNIWKALGIVGIIILSTLLNYGYNGFKKDISLHAQRLELRFDQENLRTLSALKSQESGVYELYAKGFNKSVAFEQADTSYYLFNVKYNYPSLNYLNCLKSDVEAQLESQNNNRLNTSKKNQYIDRFGSNGRDVLKKIEESGVFTESFTECSKYFGDREYSVYNYKIWDDVEEILVEDTRIKVKAMLDNKKIEEQFSKDYQTAYSQVRNNYRLVLEQQVKNSIDDILVTETIRAVTNTNTVGAWNSFTEELTYNSEKLTNIIDRILIDQWKSNSLNTGSKPYSRCFGTTNSCSGYSCSKIEVTAGGSDVLATIKNKSGRVIRHAYINSSSEYIFEVPNGSYGVYFYSGSGWNPNKLMNSGTCSSLQGGFVSRESFSKDPDPVILYNQIMYYELYEQVGGNFQTSGSNSSEAF